MQSKFCEGDIVLIVNLQSRIFWNGNLGIIQSYNKSEKKYNVIFDMKYHIYHKALYLIIPFIAYIIAYIIYGYYSAFSLFFLFLFTLYEYVYLTKSSKKKQVLLKPSNLCIVYPSNNYPTLISCIVCGIQSVSSSMLECVFCRSIFYCSSKCQSNHSFKHCIIGCDSYKTFALQQNNIITEMNNTFKFDVVAKYGTIYWLKQMNLYEKGIWSKLGGSTADNAAFGELQNHSCRSREFWRLLDTSYIPSFDAQINTPFIITNWSQYYSIKQISLESPISHFMSYVMSIYYALTNYLKIKPVIKCNEGEMKTIIIHLIGVEIELDILRLFKELLCLLPGYNFEFYCFGNTDISESMDDFETEFILNSNHIKFKLFIANYCEESINDKISCKDKRIPDLAIGLNAGFEAYMMGWRDAIKYIRKHKIASFFTEYTNASIMNANMFVKYQWFGHLSVEHIVNPFRSPLITFSNGSRFASITNGFIYGINLR